MVQASEISRPCATSSTELTAVAGAGADAGAPFHASPVATVGDDSGAGNVGRSDSDEDANPANETVMVDEVAADRSQTSGGGSLRPEMVPGWLPDRPRLCSAMAPGFGFRPGPVRERQAPSGSARMLMAVMVVLLMVTVMLVITVVF